MKNVLSSSTPKYQSVATQWTKAVFSKHQQGMLGHTIKLYFSLDGTAVAQEQIKTKPKQVFVAAHFFLPFPSSSKPWMDCVSVFFLIAFFSSLFTAAVRRTGHVHRENTWTWQDHWEGLEVETQTRENCLCKKRLRRTRNWIHECARACVCFVHVSSRGKWEGKSERERERYQCQCNGTSQWRGWKEGAHTRDETYWLQLFFCST